MLTLSLFPPLLNCHVQAILQPHRRSYRTAVISANSRSECIVQTWQHLLLVFIQPTKAAAVCEQCQQMFGLREMPTFELTCVNMPLYNIFCYLPASTAWIVTMVVCLREIISAAYRHLLNSQHLLLCSAIKFLSIKRKNVCERVTPVNVF